VLETCMKTCGKRFHDEVGKFRFLNELIKVVSPKYLGSRTSEKVKNKILELLYSWAVGLPEEVKIAEAYQMLKKQGIVKSDPKLPDDAAFPLPPPRPKNVIFEDEEKSKMLARLLKSSHPEDLRAANKLIKEMVQEDQKRMEKISKRVSAIEEVNNNVKLLTEMVTNHSQGGASAHSSEDLMKVCPLLPPRPRPQVPTGLTHPPCCPQELYQRCERMRPTLFRLASDTEDNDEALAEILQANDNLTQVINLYKQLVRGEEVNGDAAAGSIPGEGAGAGGAPGQSGTEPRLRSQGRPWPLKTGRAPRGESWGETVPGLQLWGEERTSRVPSAALVLREAAGPILRGTELMENGELCPTGAWMGVGRGGGGSWSCLFQGEASRARKTGRHPSRPSGTARKPSPPCVADLSAPEESPPQCHVPQQGRSSSLPPGSHSGTYRVKATAARLAPVPPASSTRRPPSPLGLRGSPRQPSCRWPTSPCHWSPSNPVSGPGTQAGPGWAGSACRSRPPRARGPLTLAAWCSPPGSHRQDTGAPGLAPPIIPLPLSLPGSILPVTVYDQHGFRVLFHFARDPLPGRSDVLVVVVSMLSTAPQPIRNIVFQSAVPKVMKVKLQPPSGTELPAFNPIVHPSAITQVLLLANPQKEKVRLRYKLLFTMGDQTYNEMGDVDQFPPPETWGSL
ncbi:3BP1 protein, partial [Crocuta crocuta]